MSTTLINRMMLALRAGLQFSGKRDLYEVFGYSRTPTFDDLYARYERQDIAARIVDLPAEELWNFPPTIVVSDGDTASGGSDSANTKQIQLDLQLLDSKINMYQQILRADRLCGFGRFAILFLGLPGNSESKVSGKIGINDLKYMQAYGENAVKVSSLVSDTRDSRFGMPEMYEIDIAQTEERQSTSLSLSRVQTKIKVHWTRVIHLSEKSLGNGILGIPRLRPVLNLLDDLLKIAGGSAETFWLTANRGMQVDVDKDMELSAEDADDLSAELEEYQHQLRRFVRTRGVKINSLGSDTPDPRGAFNVTTSLIAAATGIPQRILLGSEAGQLASEQDRANWANTVAKRRTEFAERVVLSTLLEHLARIGILPGLTLDKITYIWPDAFHLSPLEAAQTMAQTARAVVNLSRQAQFGGALTTLTEARKICNLPEEYEGELMPPPPTLVAPEDPEDDEEMDPEKEDMDPEDGESGTGGTGTQKADAEK